MVTSKSYEELKGLLRDAAVFGSVATILNWDQETMLPRKGAELRAEQLKAMSSLVHQKKTHPRIGELIATCEQDKSLMSDPVAAANLREMRRAYDLETKLPTSLVAEIAECSTLGMVAWRTAREKSDFKSFEPWLEKSIQLNRRKAECYGIPRGASELYDALLDTFEPGMTSKKTEEVFKPLRDFTVNLVQRVAASKKKPDVSALQIETPLEKQRQFCREISGTMGFDFEAGRMDEAAHPFCEGMGPGDTRMTNRYRPDGWLDSLSTITHEAGHGVYEQGLQKEKHFGEPLSEYLSMGFHESQSRMLENLMGRSLPFWKWALPIAKRVFAPAMDRVTVEQVFEASNIVRPGYIRVESDEVTYNLHIMLRFDFERAMIDGRLAAKDVPGEWNKRIKADFGLDVPNDAKGCLQDIHWSMCAIGYFATYTFGNIYAAQFWEVMGREIPDRDGKMERGEFGPLLAWLREKIHAHGKRYMAEDLCRQITGKGMDAQPLMKHLTQKVERVYG